MFDLFWLPRQIATLTQQDKVMSEQLAQLETAIADRFADVADEQAQVIAKVKALEDRVTTLTQQLEDSASVEGVDLSAAIASVEQLGVAIRDITDPTPTEEPTSPDVVG